MTNKMLIFALILSFCITINVLAQEKDPVIIKIEALNESYLIGNIDKSLSILGEIKKLLEEKRTVQSGVTSVKNQYIREGSIGNEKVKTDTPKNDIFRFRPLSEWVGERLIFLPQPKSCQESGYSWLWLDSPLPYNKYVGRIAKVISVIRYEDGQKSYEKGWQIEFEMEDDKSKLLAKGDDRYSESLSNYMDITPVADIDNARSKWLGKTLWHKTKSINTYDEKTGDCGSIEIKQYCPVKIIDIVAGWYCEKPIRFILRTPSGKVGYEDVDVIDLFETNPNPYYNVVSDLSVNRFRDIFLTQDPRVKHKWSTRIWSAIENAKVFVGMTQDQAAMSWGYPSDTNKTITGNSTYTQWVYKSGSYLYFENGILTSIQN
jgi:hypothetical protein